ncbi:J domain-containing protein DDB_G0295729 [Culicoides brevitarsis]|uniref:J domain-containing protein DDB_G0295729 n=1 Tax=Culicoides brevitarsis TaxID=469753 RepID=UPI00307BFEB8
MFHENSYNPSQQQHNINDYMPPFQQTITPMPNPTSWNINDLNWNFDGVQRPNHNITHFTAFTNTSPTTTTSSVGMCGKRKTIEPEPTYRPSKQFISEQKMIEHMSSMHLSSNFTNHNISPDSPFDDESFKVFLSPADLEEKLKNAQRITVCEQIKNLTKDDSLLPKALLDRANASSVSTPYCSALVLWQPPAQILKLRETVTSDKKIKEEEEEKKSREEPSTSNLMESEELFMDNNNSSSIDFNNVPSDINMNNNNNNINNEMELDEDL